VTNELALLGCFVVLAVLLVASRLASGNKP
jgi:hypothetical protein